MAQSLNAQSLLAGLVASFSIYFGCHAEGQIKQADKKKFYEEMQKVYEKKVSAEKFQSDATRLLKEGKIDLTVYLKTMDSLYFEKKISNQKMAEALSEALIRLRLDFDGQVKTVQAGFDEATQKKQSLAGDKLQKYEELLRNYKKESNERLNIIDQKISQAEKTTVIKETTQIIEEICVKIREIRGFQSAIMKNLADKHGRLSGDIPEETPTETKEFIKTETNQ